MESTLAASLLSRRWLFFIISLCFLTFIVSALPELKFNPSPRAFFGPENEDLKALEINEENYGRGNAAIMMIGPKDPAIDKILSLKDLPALQDLTAQAWHVPHAIRVESLINFQHTTVENDDLFVEDLVEDASALSADDLAKISAIALSEPTLVKRLISSDGKYAAVHVNFHFDIENEQQQESASGAAIQELADAIEQKYPSLEVYSSGTAISNVENTKLAIEDTSKLIPLMYLLMFTMLAVLLRSLLSMFAIWVVTISSAVGAVGLGAWFNITFNTMTLTSVSIIITVSVAHCVHILVHFLNSYRQGEDKIIAMQESLRVNLKPVFLTSLTTALGFLTMNFSEMPPAAGLGNVSAMGVGLAFIFSLTLLPALLILLPINNKPGKGGDMSATMDKIADFVITRHRLLLWGMLGFSAIMAVLAMQNVVNDRFSETISKPSEFRDDNEMLDSQFGGLYNIDFNLRAGDEGGISEPEYLQHVDDFATWLRAQPEVMNVFTYADTIKRLNQNMHGNNPEYYRIPESRELAAQYLLLYEMSLPYGLDINNVVNSEKSATRLLVSFPSADTNDVIELRERMLNWQQEHLPPTMQHSGTGYTIMWSMLGRRALISSIYSSIIALLLISGLLIVVLRSFRYGLISLIPNLLPAAVGFGLWAMVNGELNMALMNVMVITIGIVVDDTVHFLSKYQRAREEEGADAENAVRYAFRSVGPALWVTTLVLVSGFLMMSLSQFTPNSTMGMLTAIVLVAALILDFFLLPPLLIFMDKEKAKSPVGSNTKNEVLEQKT